MTVQLKRSELASQCYRSIESPSGSASEPEPTPQRSMTTRLGGVRWDDSPNPAAKLRTIRISRLRPERQAGQRAIDALFSWLRPGRQWRPYLLHGSDRGYRLALLGNLGPDPVRARSG